MHKGAAKRGGKREGESKRLLVLPPSLPPADRGKNR